MKDWFTVLMPTRDAAGWLDILLGHYARHGIAPVLLVDARTRDATRQIAQARGARVVENPHFDFAERLVAMSAELVTTPWTLFVNDDEVPSEAMFARLRGRPPGARVRSIAIPRRWVWPGSEATGAGAFKPGALSHGFCAAWEDRAGDPGADHHWRLFRQDRVTFIAKMHTDGHLVEDWARLRPDECLLHFEWVARSYAQRRAKLTRYDRARFGYGKFFESYYLPEDQPPGVFAYRPLGTAIYDSLAAAYFTARPPDAQPARRAARDVLRHWLHRAGIGRGSNRLRDEPADRADIRPQRSREVAYDAM